MPGKTKFGMVYTCLWMLTVLVVKGIPEDEKMVEECGEITADNIVHIAKLS